MPKAKPKSDKTKSAAKPEESRALAPITLEAAEGALAHGGDLATLRGLDENAIGFIYAYAALHYQQGAYDMARAGFRFLCAHRHDAPDLWVALARTAMAMGDYGEALRAYVMALHLRPSALSALEAARACLALSVKMEAGAFLKAARALSYEEKRDALLPDIELLEARL